MGSRNAIAHTKLSELFAKNCTGRAQTKYKLAAMPTSQNSRIKLRFIPLRKRFLSGTATPQNVTVNKYGCRRANHGIHDWKGAWIKAK